MRILETKHRDIFFFPSQAKKTKPTIFHLWHERMGGCFYKKFPLIPVLTLTSGFGFIKFQMDKFPGGKEVIFFFLKDVFWLLALLTTLKADPRTSDEDVLPLGSTVFPPSWLGPSLIQPLTEMFTRTGTSCGCWRVVINVRVHFSAQLRAGLMSLLCFISTEVESQCPSYQPTRQEG